MSEASGALYCLPWFAPESGSRTRFHIRASYLKASPLPNCEDAREATEANRVCDDVERSIDALSESDLHLRTTLQPF